MEGMGVEVEDMGGIDCPNFFFLLSLWALTEGFGPPSWEMETAMMYRYAFCYASLVRVFFLDFVVNVI